MQGFSWECISFSSKMMEILITFDNPNYISKSQNGLDILKVEIQQPELFMSKSSFKLIEQEDTEMLSKIQTQLSIENEGLIESLTEQIESVKQSIILFSSSSAAVQILLSSSLTLLWGLINSLQIVVHFPLLVIKYPENAMIASDMLYQIASLELIPEDFKQDVIGLVIQQDDQQAEDDAAIMEKEISQQVKDAGFESTSGLSNNFLTILVLCAVTALLIFVALCYQCARRFQKVR